MLGFDPTQCYTWSRPCVGLPPCVSGIAPAWRPPGCAPRRSSADRTGHTAAGRESPASARYARTGPTPHRHLYILVSLFTLFVNIAATILTVWLRPLHAFIPSSNIAKSWIFTSIRGF